MNTKKRATIDKLKTSLLDDALKKNAKKLIRWSVDTRIFSFGRKILGDILHDAFEYKGIISYDDPQRRRVIGLINKIKEETEILQSNHEAYNIYMLAKRSEKIEGDIAEVGVYRGGTAKLICEVKGNRSLHLFDTFEGIPQVEEVDEPGLRRGQFAGSLEEIELLFEDYSNVYCYKGLFPDTAEPVREKKFSLVHIDVDTYASTLSCLKFFYPRMSGGGIILSHDYISVAGVSKAFDEFLEDKPEPIIEMAGSQCLVLKLGI